MKMKDVNFAPIVVLALMISSWLVVLSAVYGGIQLYRNFFPSGIVASGICLQREDMAFLAEDRHEFVSNNSQALVVRFTHGPIIYRHGPDSLLTSKPDARYYWHTGNIMPSRFELREM